MLKFPSKIGHLGQQSGDFAGAPSWGGVVGVADDALTFATVVGGSAGAMRWANGVGTNVTPWDPTVKWKGGEVVLATERDVLRVNPTGARGASNPLARRPHYHRRIVDPATGQTISGGGIGKHRPWEGW